MPTTLADLARLVEGRVLGDGSRQITGANTLAAAGPDDITLLDSPDKAHRLARCRAATVVVPSGYTPEDRAAIQVDDVHAAFAQVVRHFRPPHTSASKGISPLASVSPTSQISDSATIHPGATIGDDVTIGAGSIVHGSVQILPGCRIADEVTIFPGAVLYENT